MVPPELRAGPTGLDDHFTSELRQLLVSNQKLEAIKRYRERAGVGLKEAKDAVEALARGPALPTVAAAPQTPGSLESVRALAAQGKKLEAIKRYRALTGLGLAEAKAAVEAMEDERPINHPPGHAPNRPFDDDEMPPASNDARLADVAQLIQHGQQIEAIKRYREITGAGLPAAKEAVEGFEHNGRWAASSLRRSAPLTPHAPPTAAGHPMRVIMGIALSLIMGAAGLIAVGLMPGSPAEESQRIVIITAQSTALKATEAPAPTIAVPRTEVAATYAPTEAPTANFDATSTAEAQALRDSAKTLFAAQAEWPVAVSDTFTANTLNWPEKTVQDATIIIQPRLNSEAYVWDVTPKHGNVYENLLPDPEGEYSDFSASVDVRFPQGANGPEYTYGLIVRHVDDDYALCGIQNDGSFRLLIVYDSGIYTLIASGSDTIQQGPKAVNRLQVISHGDDFVCLVNGEPLWAWNEPMAPGGIGLGVDVENDDGASQVIFDNFEIRAP
jgi:ribosomal protein L7/L12